MAARRCPSLPRHHGTRGPTTAPAGTQNSKHLRQFTAKPASPIGFRDPPRSTSSPVAPTTNQPRRPVCEADFDSTTPAVPRRCRGRWAGVCFTTLNGAPVGAMRWMNDPTSPGARCAQRASIASLVQPPHSMTTRLGMPRRMQWLAHVWRSIWMWRCLVRPDARRARSRARRSSSEPARFGGHPRQGTTMGVQVAKRRRNDARSLTSTEARWSVWSRPRTRASPRLRPSWT